MDIPEVVGGDARRRNRCGVGRLPPGDGDGTHCVRPTIAGPENRALRLGLCGLRMGTSAGPVWISRTDIVGRVGTLVLTSPCHLGRLHEPANGAALNQQSADEQDDQRPAPPHEPEWACCRAHGKWWGDEKTEAVMNSRPRRSTYTARPRIIQ